MRRPEKRRGQQLEVLVRFSGVDANGAAWRDEWLPSIQRLSGDLKKVARRMEQAQYPTARQANRPRGQRISPRLEVIYENDEQDEEAAWDKEWAAYAAEAAAEAAGQ